MKREVCNVIPRICNNRGPPRYRIAPLVTKPSPHQAILAAKPPTPNPSTASHGGSSHSYSYTALHPTGRTSGKAPKKKKVPLEETTVRDPPLLKRTRVWAVSQQGRSEAREAPRGGGVVTADSQTLFRMGCGPAPLGGSLTAGSWSSWVLASRLLLPCGGWGVDGGWVLAGL